MLKTRTLALTLVATTMIGGVALANEQAKSLGTPEIPAAQRVVDRDVGKLSKDGAQAFRDLHLARIAIFDAAPDQAKADIRKAQEALTKAKTDETLFTKAEADLKAPATKPTQAAATASAKAAPSTQPVAWLPIDGQLTLGEDFVATPTKAAAVTDANKSLEKGDRKAAIDRLKLADVDMNFVLAVVPLNQTTTDVDQAASLVGQGKYYEANAMLKKVEDGVRFDMVDVVGLPNKTATATPAATPAAPQK